MSDLKVYNFMGLRKFALAFSILMLVASVGSLSTKGLVFGFDFSGGTQIEVGYEKPADVSVLRQQLVSAGFESPVVVHFGAETDVLIRLQGEPDQTLAERVYSVYNRTAITLSCAELILLALKLVKSFAKMAGWACLQHSQ